MKKKLGNTNKGNSVSNDSADSTKLRSMQVSLLMATVIAGLGVQRVWEEYLTYTRGATETTAQSPTEIKFFTILILPAIALTVTILRFFHGNVVWYNRDTRLKLGDQDLTPLQRFISRIGSYYVHICQYILFFIAALNLRYMYAFIVWMLTICIVDVVWSFISWLSMNKGRSPILYRALGSWAIINLVSSALCILALGKYKSFQTETIVGVSILFLSAAVADYAYNKELFFGY